MKFVIQKGQPFEAIISVKKSGSPTPATIVSVGSFIVTSVEDNCLLIDSQMQIEDFANGKIKVSLTSSETKKLPTKTGLPEDGSKGLQTCKAMLSVTTEDAGLFFVNIPEVYVEGAGEICQA